MKKNMILKIIITALLVLLSFLTITSKAFAVVSVKDDNNNELKAESIDSVENEVIVVYSKDDWMTTIKGSIDSAGQYIETNLLQIKSPDVDEIDDIENIITEDGNIKISLIKSNKYSTEELIDLLKDKPYVKSVTPNYIFPVQSLTNDPYLQYQYAIEAIEGNGVNADADINPMSTYSEQEIVIAILDTGVSYEGTELESVLWTNPYDKSIIPGTHGYNFAEHNDDLTDNYGHGTLVASQIGAKSNDSTGITGSLLDTPNVKIMMLKCGTDGGLTMSAIYEAYNYIYNVQELGTKVVSINNSWGNFLKENSFNFLSNEFKPLVEMVGHKGAVSVVAAGNNANEIDKNGKGLVHVLQEDGSYVYEEQYYFPAGIDTDYIMVVSGTNEYGYLRKTIFNYGEGVDIAAPGEHILGLQPRKGFISSLLSEEEKNNCCEVFYDFDDGDLTLFDIDKPENVTITATDDMFYGSSGKSVKISVEVKDSDFTLNEYGSNQYDLIIPLNISIGKQISSNKYIDFKMRGDTKNQGQQKDTFSRQGYYVDAYLDDGVNQLDLFITTNDIPNSYWKSWGAADTISEFFNVRFHPEEARDTTLYLRFHTTKAGTHVFYIDDFALSKPINEIDVDLRKNYYESSGTSFAAPFVSGAIATMANIHEDYDALQLKQAVLDNAIQTDKLDGVIDGKRMLNIYKLYGKTTITEDVTNMTNKDVTISISSNNHNEGVKIQYKINDGVWIDYSSPFKVSENVTIYTRVADSKDTLDCQSLEITNIDKIAPTITGIEETVYQEDAKLPTPIATDNVNVQSVILTKDGNRVDNYVPGTKIIEAGEYELKAIDAAQNEATISFTILPVYYLKGSPNSTIEDIAESSGLENVGYDFLDSDGNVVEDTETTKTGMKIKTQEDITYNIIIKGDLNGDGQVSVRDLALTQKKILVVKFELSKDAYKAGDIDNNGLITIKDLASIQRYMLTGKGL